MRSLDDNSAVSSIIGALFVFSFLIIGLSINQSEVVPNENKQVEFQHSQKVAEQMVSVRNAIVNTGASGEPRSQQVSLGLDYPPRVVGVNAGPAAGSLRTGNPGDVSNPQLKLSNVKAADSEVADYWDGSTRTYTTKEINYNSNYNYYSAAPSIRYENTVLYKEGPNGGIAVQTDQQLISGARLDLTVLQGEISKSTTGGVAVDMDAPAGDTRTIQVENKGGPITIIVHSSLTVAKWEEILAAELDENGNKPNKYISSIGPGAGTNEIEITLEQDNRYALEIPAARVGSGTVPVGGQAYITGISGSGTSIPEGGTEQLTVEVRNKFNGQMPSKEVCASVTGREDDIGSASVDSPATTDENGQATVSYAAPGSVDSSQTAEIQVSYDCSGGTPNPDPDSTDKDQVLFDVTVFDSGEGGDSADAVTYRDGSASGGNKFKFNLNVDGAVKIQEVSIDTTNMPNGARTGAQLQKVEITGTERYNTKYNSDGTVLDISDTIIGGSSDTVVFRQFKPKLPGGGYTQIDEPSSGEYIIVTLRYKDESQDTFYFKKN